MSETAATPSPDRRATARVLYEGDPSATIAKVAEQMGVTMKLVQRWRADDAAAGRPWQKVQARMPDLQGRALQAAEALDTTLADTGQELTDPKTSAEVAQTAAERFAVDLRAQVLDRHKREWAGPRKIAYKAMQQADKGDTDAAFNTGRVAKVLAETLTLVQTGERRAHGIKDTDIDAPAFIIERTE